MAADETLLEVENLTVAFPTDEGIVQAVRGVNFTLEPGRVLGIAGESGSGKSVTTLAIMGLLPRSARVAGSVRFRGQELLGLSERAFEEIRGRRISVIFQDPMTSLNPMLRVERQMTEGIQLHLGKNKAEARAHAIEMLRRVGIPAAERRIRDYPHQFSGGMRQRVMIAIALACNPKLLIADEPTTALDVTVQAQILELISAVCNEFGTALILITHDLGVVAGVADRVVVMYAGRVVEEAPTEELFKNPRMPYTIGLLESVPRLDDRVHGELKTIEGAPPDLLNPPSGCYFMPRCFFARSICRTRPPLEPLPGNPTHRKACWVDVTDPAEQAYAERRRQRRAEAQKATIEAVASTQAHTS